MVGSLRYTLNPVNVDIGLKWIKGACRRCGSEQIHPRPSCYSLGCPQDFCKLLQAEGLLGCIPLRSPSCQTMPQIGRFAKIWLRQLHALSATVGFEVIR